MYARRIERVIDTREKMNIIMNWPKSPFYKFIYDGVITGFGGAPIPAYKNDSLVSTYTAEEVLTRGAVEEVVQVYPDPENYPDWYIDSVIYSQFRPEDIIRYRIIEDWILDKQRGMFFPRIIAIAPLYRLEVEGQDLGEQALFYVKWDDLRPILTNQEVFNRHNDRSRLSFDDFFEHRLFSSYIVKESNAFDYDINKFEHFKDDPFAALLESEKIKNKLFEWEHDLWKY
jgi:gliding motility associated protien GldN